MEPRILHIFHIDEVPLHMVMMIVWEHFLEPFVCKMGGGEMLLICNY